MTLTLLWDRLQSIRACKFITQSRSARATGWSGSGSGKVAVESPSDTILLFRESGIWHPDSGGALRFHNVYRWTHLDADGTIRLEHLRFGEDRPVYLCDLAPTPDGTWISIAPHLCRQDTYAAKLRLEEQALFLTWTVQGPEKDEQIEYVYSSAD